jgi:hypothetical protein
MAENKLDLSYFDPTYGGRFARRSTEVVAHRRDSRTVSFSVEMRGKDYQGAASYSHSQGAIVLTQSELEKIKAEPQGDPRLLAHHITGEIPTHYKVMAIRALRD